MIPVLKLLRVHHWVKNGLIFLPLTFGGGLTDGALFLTTLAGALCFCCLASAIYVMNDLAEAIPALVGTHASSSRNRRGLCPCGFDNPLCGQGCSADGFDKRHKFVNDLFVNGAFEIDNHIGNPFNGRPCPFAKFGMVLIDVDFRFVARKFE